MVTSTLKFQISNCNNVSWVLGRILDRCKEAEQKPFSFQAKLGCKIIKKTQYKTVDMYTHDPISNMMDDCTGLNKSVISFDRMGIRELVLKTHFS